MPVWLGSQNVVDLLNISLMLKTFLSQSSKIGNGRMLRSHGTLQVETRSHFLCPGAALLTWWWEMSRACATSSLLPAQPW